MPAPNCSQRKLSLAIQSRRALSLAVQSQRSSRRPTQPAIYIRGATTHYDAVAGSAASGLMSASLNSGVPVIFGILTTENMDQAIDRAGGKVGNKETEATLTAALADTHFLFVHGLGHGAWCWYKIVTILQEIGYQATALDMISDGRDKTDAKNVTSLAQYAWPLTDYLADVSGQVVIVGHSLGGIAVSYAMELYPEKISKAIFLAALMPLNNQTGLTTCPPNILPRLLSESVFIMNYENGPSLPPTSIAVNLTKGADIFYNQSPSQDVTLGLSLLDVEPYSVFTEVLSLTPSRYGSIRRFFLKTDQDNVFLSAGLDFIINQNPPERVFFIPSSDHSPFFSETLILTALLVRISSL